MGVIRDEDVTKISLDPVAKDYPICLRIATVVKVFCPLRLRIFFQLQGPPAAQSLLLTGKTEYVSARG